MSRKPKSRPTGVYVVLLVYLSPIRLRWVRSESSDITVEILKKYWTGLKFLVQS